jgi:SAM-dependent methyltransferase
MNVWIGYTTKYREGGPKFARAARTLGEARARALALPRARVVVEAVESKRDFVDAMARAASRGGLRELHFIGHSGLYGPMFRTTATPEQFSPHEWRGLALPFAPGGEAFFHACRSARWFAPFFARTFGVPAHGYHLYTTFSRRPDRFAWDAPFADAGAPLWVVALPGKKSHGALASVLKYAHVMPVEAMKRFEPKALSDDPSYDPVADLYDEAFEDIGVRRREVEWIERRLALATALAGTRAGDRSLRVLDVGTGNGALLGRLSPRIARGIGVDASAGMIARARRRFGALPNVSFHSIEGPVLPIDDASIDVAVSCLSWRYLDWDPMMAELRRVLAPGGRILVVDMVALPSRLIDAPRLVAAKAEQLHLHVQRPHFRRALRRLVADPRWKTMLTYNPMRAEHEYRWYFGSRFPHGTFDRLSVGLSSRVVAFDSGPLERGFSLPQSYP